MRISISGPARLLKSLEMPPSRPELQRARDADDKIALANLLRDDAVAGRATTPDTVRLLWDICQIPDFRKTMAEVHANLLGRIFRELTDGEFLPADWVADQVAQLDRVDGDIDTLMARIAHIRTWTYISHRADWLRDADTWQSRTRELEDKISDALHNSLTQRFVDRRAALTRMKEDDDYSAVVGVEGDVSVGGEFVGHLDGFRFVPDASAAASGRQAYCLPPIRRSAVQSIPVWMPCAMRRMGSFPSTRPVLSYGRAQPLPASKKGLISSRPRYLYCRRLSVRRPARTYAQTSADMGKRAAGRLPRTPDSASWRDARRGGSRVGLSYRRGACSIPRVQVLAELRDMSKEDRSALRSCGVRIGPETLFLPTLVKPKAVQWRALLWALFNDKLAPTIPGAGLVTVPAGEDADRDFLAACGFACLGGRAIRVDVLDRVAVDLQRQSRAGKMDVGATQLNLLGLSLDDARPVFEGLGYVSEEEGDTLVWKWNGRPKTVSGRPRKVSRGRERVNPANPVRKAGNLRKSMKIRRSRSSANSNCLER